MPRTVLPALAWAIVIFAIAVAGAADVIPKASAQTLVIVLPAIAVATLGAGDGKTCFGARA